MDFVNVSDENIMEAGRIHSEAWKQSHRSFCSPAFVEAHTPEHQMKYLQDEMMSGKQIWMLIDEEPVGIVSVKANLVENLYVLPEKQRIGYGSKLIEFAIGQCTGCPVLYVLNINDGACRLYRRVGFVETGTRKQLNETLTEIEMILKR